MLQLGCSLRSLSPSFPVCLHGYASRNYRTDKIEDPVELGCLALETGKKRVLLFTADIIGISYDLCQSLSKELAEATGISCPDI